MFERKTSKLQKPSEVQKGIPHLHPITIPDYHEKLELPENGVATIVQGTLVQGTVVQGTFVQGECYPRRL